MPAKKFNSVTIDPAKAKPTRRYGQYNMVFLLMRFRLTKKQLDSLEKAAPWLTRKSKLKVIYV